MALLAHVATAYAFHPNAGLLSLRCMQQGPRGASVKGSSVTNKPAPIAAHIVALQGAAVEAVESAGPALLESESTVEDLVAGDRFRRQLRYRCARKRPCKTCATSIVVACCALFLIDQSIRCLTRAAHRAIKVVRIRILDDYGCVGSQPGFLVVHHCGRRSGGCEGGASDCHRRW